MQDMANGSPVNYAQNTGLIVVKRKPYDAKWRQPFVSARFEKNGLQCAAFRVAGNGVNYS